MENVNTLASIVDEDATPGWKADQCLRLVSDLTWDDLQVPALLAVAQTYAILEVADAIGHDPSGFGLTTMLWRAHGSQ